MTEPPATIRELPAYARQRLQLALARRIAGLAAAAIGVPVRSLLAPPLQGGGGSAVAEAVDLTAAVALGAGLPAATIARTLGARQARSIRDRATRCVAVATVDPTLARRLARLRRQVEGWGPAAATGAGRSAAAACEAGVDQATANGSVRRLSRKDAAAELGISRQRLERLIHKGRIAETAAGVDIDQAKAARAAPPQAGRPRHGEA